MSYEKSEEILILTLDTIITILKNMKKVRNIIKKKTKKVKEQII